MRNASECGSSYREHILQGLAAVLTEELGRSRRYAWLARRAVMRIAKLVKVPVQVPRHVPGDPNDDPIVQTALTGKVHYLVTADREILKLAKVHAVEIITAERLDELLSLTT